MQQSTTIRVGDSITVVHPLDNHERTGVVENIAYMAERDDIRVRLAIGSVILMLRPGTKRKMETGE